MFVIALSLINQIPLALFPAVGALPWLMLLTWLTGRWLSSPACSRALSRLACPALAFGLLGMAELCALSVLFAASIYIWTPQAMATVFWSPLALAGVCQLAGTVLLIVWTRRRPPGMLLLLAMGTLFLAAQTALFWTGENNVRALYHAWRGMTQGLGPAAALALVGYLRAVPCDREAMFRTPDEALPVRWFAALAAAVYSWRLIRRFIHVGIWFPRRILPKWKASDLSGYDMLSLAQEGLIPGLWSACIICWLAVAFRPGRPRRISAACLALLGLAGAWLVAEVPMMWATWRGFQP